MASNQREQRNVGVFAHIDAGKTTTTEQMLYKSGRIKTLGSVDSGTAQTDWLDVERERGISVRSAVTRLNWKNATINLIDTPGHADFISEVERSLRIMDGAILVISAAEGVQAQTEVIWQALQELQIPTLIYINKLDRIGANPEKVIEQIRELLSPHAAPIQLPNGTEGQFSDLNDFFEGHERHDSFFYQLLMETVAELDDELMMTYFEKDSLTPDEMLPTLKRAIHRAEMYPILLGASKLGIGIEQLLDAICQLLPPPKGQADGPVSGIVFKLERDKVLGRVAYVRMYSGMIKNRDIVQNHTQQIEEKVTQIRRIDGQKTEDIGLLEAGDIAAVFGFSEVKIGDVIGTPEFIPGDPHLATPLLTVQVHWADDADYTAVVAAFQELADEDPHLDLQWLQDERELHLKVMGPIHMEVLTQLVESRFGLDITLGEPSVIYKETPIKAGVGFIAYTMPKPCWAVLKFDIEPLPEGSGIEYSSIVRTEAILERYQKEVARRIPEALEQGLYGWEVTDIKITLVEGEDHVMHTHPLDFVVATPMGIMDGLANTGTKLLEPMLSFKLSVPEEFSGKVMNELVVMRGEYETPDVKHGRLEIVGKLPVATSLDFPARLGSLTKGRGTLATQFSHYQEAPPDVHAERRRRGVNPLDQSKYILYVRNALSS